MRDAQTKLVAASREVQAAETALKDAGGPKRAPQDAMKRCTLARSSLLLARSEYGAAQSAKDAAEKAVTTTAVQLPGRGPKKTCVCLASSVGAKKSCGQSQWNTGGVTQ